MASMPSANPPPYARVADGRSTSLEGGASATATSSPPARRWTRKELEARLERAPRFEHERPDKQTLDRMVEGYERVTGDRVRRPAKVNLVATAYRVHGEGFLLLVEFLFTARGSSTNLLGEIRCTGPIEAARLMGAAAAMDLDQSVDEPTTVVNEQPTAAAYVDAGSDGRADGFFSDDELGPRQAPSRAKAGRR